MYNFLKFKNILFRNQHQIYIKGIDKKNIYIYIKLKKQDFFFFIFNIKFHY